MLARALILVLRLGLALGFAVALGATGFAHHLPTSPSASQAEALAFAAANGVTYADFCGDVPARGQDPNCLACQITGASDLASVCLALIDLPLAMTAPMFAMRPVVPARVLDPSRSPQGPPRRLT